MSEQLSHDNARAHAEQLYEALLEEAGRLQAHDLLTYLRTQEAAFKAEVEAGLGKDAEIVPQSPFLYTLT